MWPGLCGKSSAVTINSEVNQTQRGYSVVHMIPTTLPTLDLQVAVA